MGGPYFRSRCALVGILLVLLFWPTSEPLAKIRGPYTHREILDALRWVETRDRAHPPDGDGGKAIGPYQIHRSYWQDARLDGEYEQCRDRAYAECVIEAYMLRYVPEAWWSCDPEVIARTHNGGPKGRFKAATDRYWRAVENTLHGRPPP
jgi:hypothetical protein